MNSLRAHLWRLMLKWTTDWDQPIPVLRRRAERSARMIPMPEGCRVDPARAGGVPAEWLLPAGVSAERGVLLHLHGGGFVMGSCATHRALVARLAKACHLAALLPEYRLAPEHPYPAALDDALAVYCSLLRKGVPAERIVVSGDSAGAGLALSLMIALRNQGEALPGLAVLISPWVDLTLGGRSIETRAHVDPWVDPAALARAAELYANGRDPALAALSPLRADLRGLPDLLIHVGGDEVLLDDAERLAARAKAAGVAVSLERWEGLWHVFHCLAPRLPEAGTAIARIGRFVRARRPVAVTVA